MNPQAKKAALVLRLALAFVFIYAAVRALYMPTAWIGFIPDWVDKLGFTRERFLFITSMFEITLGLLLISNFKTKLLAIISALFLLSITVFSGFGILDLTFRDVGLFLAAWALFYIAE